MMDNKKDLIRDLIKDEIEVLEEVLIEEIIDLEILAKKDEKPKKAQKYRIRVDKDYFIVHSSEMTGREILTLAGKNPPERYRLDQKFKGGRTKKVELDEIIDFTTHGLERFMTLPLDQTEG